VSETTSTALPPLLAFDVDAELARVTGMMRACLVTLRRRGFVLGLSGGIDSAVTAALAVRAADPSRVLGLVMPEEESDPLSQGLALQLAGALCIETRIEDLGPVLRAAGCYAIRDAAIRELEPSYGPGWRCKIVRPSPLEAPGPIALNWLVVESPLGETRRIRLTGSVYRTVVAATNMKQRLRKQTEYFHADRMNYAVAGTQNRLEHRLGFFVKNGDNSADVKPIAHLYKTQLSTMAEALGVPADILARQPTTDTWPLPQTQEEFFYGVPVRVVDVCLAALEGGAPAGEAATQAGLTPLDVERIWRDLERKRAATAYQRDIAGVLEPHPAPRIRLP
jgi:NAD+ synthase